VLEKQKQLAAAMAAKRGSSSAGAAVASSKPSAAAAAAAAASSSTTPATLKAGGLTFTKKISQPHTRPTKRKAAPNSSSSEVVDLTGDSEGKPKSDQGKKILGIHKSFKRPSPAAALAIARAKANGDEPPFKKFKGTTTTDQDKQAVARRVEKGHQKLKSLVQNASKSTNDDAAASYAINITPNDFWKNIRSWDFVTDLARQQLEETSNFNKTDDKDDDKAGDAKKPVPDTFINCRHYIAVWAPLCLAECRSQLLSEVMTEYGQMNSRSSPLLLVDVDTTWKTGNRGNHQHHDQLVHSELLTDTIDSCHVMIKAKKRGDGNRKFFPHDICCLVPVEKKDTVEALLRGQQRGKKNTNNGSLFNNSYGFQEEVFLKSCVVGHTKAHRSSVDGLILKISKRKWAQVGTKEMYLLRIGSNITALREFTALCNLELIALNKFILGQHIDEAKRSGQIKKLGQAGDAADPRHKMKLLKNMGGVEALGKGFTNYVYKKFNPSQLMAISQSSQGYGDGGFTLIKGPPGTGKTTTLVNILNALHIRQFNKYYDEVRKLVALPTGSRSAALEMALTHKPRLLVCAPSNAAVDNVIMKIMEDGFIDGSGQRYNPSMIRVGVGQSKTVKDVALETRVDQILSENSDAQELESSIAGFRMELQRITNDIVKCRKRIHAVTNASPWPLGKDWEIRVDEETFDETGRVYFVNHKEQMTTFECPPPPEPGETQFQSRSMPEYKAFMSRSVKLVESYFNIKSNLELATIVKGSMGNGASDFELRQNLEMHVLNSVHMVMTTLGTAGSRALTEGVDKFEVVVVDEAAQSVEPATLSALQLGSRHCVMVGDPQQLPATIFNVSGKTTKYDRSLFQRLEEAGEEVYMLNEQYRMHPKISHFPRHIFYKGALKDGPNVLKPDYGNPLERIITSAVPALQPFTVLDLDSKEERGGTSLSNSSEAHLAVHLYVSLKQITNGLCTKDRVAVITPYSQQAGLLRKCFGDLLGDDYARFIEVNTVDAFQGREAKIVIFSAVRAAGSHGIGFLSDVRRMNVALTRAKHFLFVIARCQSIVINPYWKDLVEHARDTNAVISVPILGRFSGKTTFPPVRDWRLVGGPPAGETRGNQAAASNNSIPPLPCLPLSNQNMQGNVHASLASQNMIPPPPPPVACIPPPPPPQQQFQQHQHIFHHQSHPPQHGIVQSLPPPRSQFQQPQFTLQHQGQPGIPPPPPPPTRYPQPQPNTPFSIPPPPPPRRQMLPQKPADPRKSSSQATNTKPADPRKR
jgi:senataxin